MSAPAEILTIVKTDVGYKIYQHNEDDDIKELVKTGWCFYWNDRLYHCLESAFLEIVKRCSFPIIQYYNSTYHEEIFSLQNEKSTYEKDIELIQDKIFKIDEKIKELEVKND